MGLRLTVLLLACLLIASTLQTQICSKGCLRCGSNGCSQCYNTRLVKKSSGNLAELMNLAGEETWDCAPQLPNDRCAEYIFGSDKRPVCNQCKPGYSYKHTIQDCVPSKIDGCFTSYYLNDSREVCYACYQGFITEEGDRCISYSEEPSKKAENCIVGNLANLCEICEEGYYQLEAKCVKVGDDKSKIGCRGTGVLGLDQCMYGCNAYNGWYHLSYDPAVKRVCTRAD